MKRAVLLRFGCFVILAISCNIITRRRSWEWSDLNTKKGEGEGRAASLQEREKNVIAISLRISEILWEYLRCCVEFAFRTCLFLRFSEKLWESQRNKKCETRLCLHCWCNDVITIISHHVHRHTDTHTRNDGQNDQFLNLLCTLMFTTFTWQRQKSTNLSIFETTSKTQIWWKQPRSGNTYLLWLCSCLC